MSDIITENNIKVGLSEHHDNPKNSTTFYNSKMKINRL